jgi:hypothetical protein
MMVTTKRLPIGRMGTVTDIAKGVVFLASPIPALWPAPASSSTAGLRHNDPPSYACQPVFNPIHRIRKRGLGPLTRVAV